MYGRGKKLNKPKKKQNIKKPLYQKRTKKKLKIEYLEMSRHFLKQTKKKKKERNEREKEENNERFIKGRIIRDIWTFFNMNKMKIVILLLT